MKKLIIISISLAFALSFVGTFNKAFADDFSDTVKEELNAIDLSEAETLLGERETPFGSSFTEIITKLINGETSVDYGSFAEYLKGIILIKINGLIPFVISLIIISLSVSLLSEYGGEKTGDSVCQTVKLIAVITAFLVFMPILKSFYSETKNTIENIAKLNEIMSPIITALMITCGGNVSASTYKPSVIFLTNGVVNVFLVFVLPLVFITLIFSFFSVVSKGVNLTKFSDFFYGLIKWTIGLVSTVFGLFTAVGGIASASYDGVSFKVAKFAFSNSVPIIGGIINGGFDMVVASSYLIKNSIGIASLIFIFSVVFVPVLEIGVFSLALKLVSAVVKPFSDGFMSELCSSVSKSLSFLVASLLIAGLMFFVVTLLAVLSLGSVF